MKPLIAVLVLLSSMLIWRPSPAQEQTTTFTVDNMTCALCPVTVRMAIQRVDGVHDVTVDLDSGTATVSFDAAAATVEQIAAASTNAGYPARVSE